MMMQHDKREEERRLRLPKDPNLPVLQIDAQRPALVSIAGIDLYKRIKQG